MQSIGSPCRGRDSLQHRVGEEARVCDVLGHVQPLAVATPELPHLHAAGPTCSRYVCLQVKHYLPHALLLTGAPHMSSECAWSARHDDSRIDAARHIGVWRPAACHHLQRLDQTFTCAKMGLLESTVAGFSPAVGMLGSASILAAKHAWPRPNGADTLAGAVSFAGRAVTGCGTACAEQARHDVMPRLSKGRGSAGWQSWQALQRPTTCFRVAA